MKKILVIEDNPSVSDLIQIRLSKEGYEIAVEHDGLKALKAAKETRPDLIILDAILPGMDGLTLANELLKDPQTADIPVLLVSASVQLEQVFADKKNVAGFIHKPFSVSDFVAKVKLSLKG
jgi:CheY-like chemotaxis protein